MASTMESTDLNTAGKLAEESGEKTGQNEIILDLSELNLNGVDASSASAWAVLDKALEKVSEKMDLRNDPRMEDLRKANEVMDGMLALVARGLRDGKNANYDDIDFKVDLRGANLSGVDLSIQKWTETDTKLLALASKKNDMSKEDWIRAHTAIIANASTPITGISNKKISTEEFKEILALHDKWLRNEEGGKRADLHDMNLTGIEMRNVCLREADVSGARFGRELQGIDLRGANMRGACVDVADMTGSKLNGADMTNVRMRLTKLNGSDLSEVNASKTDCYGTDFTNAILTKAIFKKAKLERCVLHNSNFSQADTSGADMTKTQISECDFRGAEMKETDLRESVVKETTFAESNMTGANMDRADFSEAGENCFSGTDLTKTKWNNAIFRNQEKLAVRVFCGSEEQTVIGRVAGSDKTSLTLMVSDCKMKFARRNGDVQVINKEMEQTKEIDLTRENRPVERQLPTPEGVSL